jgi:putative transposase
VFSPFNLHHIEVRYHDRSYGLAVPFQITRHIHPKARPEIPEPPPAATGISYLDLVSATHQQHLATDTRIGFQALYPSPDTTDLDLDTLAADPITDPTTGATEEHSSEVSAAQEGKAGR